MRFVGRLLLSLLLAGCTHVNEPLSHQNIALENRGKNNTRASMGAEPTRVTDPNLEDAAQATTVPATMGDGYFVGLALSGGGSRSANFSAACMFELQRIGLLRQVDYISAVSGGSLAGAYYCIAGEEWNPGNVQKKLSQSFATDVVVQSLLPWNIFAGTFTGLDRSDLLAGSFNQRLFSNGGKTLRYRDLRSDRPRLLLNTTDLQSGKQFVICNESFDQLNSDLGTFPLSYAVAASSAVPVLLHQVTLRDYSTVYKQFRHLIDGGVVDNLGVETLMRVYSAHMTAAHEQGARDPYPNGAIILVVDARTQFDAKLSEQGDMGLVDSLVAAAGLSSAVLINRASAATLAELVVDNADATTSARELRSAIEKMEQTGRLDMRDRFGHTVRVAHIGLSRLNDISDLPFESFNESVNNIATYFNISSTEAYHLNIAARLIIGRRYEPWLTELAGEVERSAHR